MKLRVVSLLVFVAVTSTLVAGGPSTSPLILLAVGTAGLLAASGSSAINCYLDRDIDAIMRRTKQRPLPASRLTAWECIFFGLGLIGLSLALAWSLLNPLTALLILSGALIYLVVYTSWLKRRSSWSTLLGGVSGCIPALVGSAAVTGNISGQALMMALLVLVWIPSHNWTLALLSKEDYEAAGIRVLPALVSQERALAFTFAASIFLFVFSVAIYALHFGGFVYLAAVLIMGSVMLLTQFRALRDPARHRILFAFKVLSVYLAVLFSSMVIDVFIQSPVKY